MRSVSLEAKAVLDQMRNSLMPTNRELRTLAAYSDLIRSSRGKPN